jgi:ParB-like chromosome segregation protein Spo0J
MNITEIPLSEIKPYPNNPRKNKKGIAAVKRSIEAFGFTQPIIVNSGRVILCGHTRYEAAKELNLPVVPVIVKTDLTPQQERAYRIADNRVTQETDWDKWKLRSEFNELFSDGDYFTGFKRTIDELREIIKK